MVNTHTFAPDYDKYSLSWQKQPSNSAFQTSNRQDRICIAIYLFPIYNKIIHLMYPDILKLHF